MRRLFKKNWVNFAIIIAFAVFVAVSFSIDYNPGKSIFKEQFYSFFKEMILFLPIMFILIGLGDVWINREKVEKHIGKDSGLKGILLAIFLSMAQAGPLYGAFPVTYLLWKKGASIRNIFIYIGAFCTIKIPMITFEIGFLGWKFSILRTLLSLPIIILIAIIMEKYLKNRKFEVHEV
ncbi:MAG TPA: hypothetical protein DCR40_01565 [Prolixibacteraceae bacterium]|nr:hypothetical protein [Prolixibacteraceae bacterium]